MVLPTSLVNTAISKAHQGGHPGETNLKRRLRYHFWWPEMNKAIKAKIEQCKPCQLYTGKTTREPQDILEVPRKAWEQVALDLFGPMPNNKHVLVAQDTLTRFPAAKIVPNTKTTSVIPAIDEIYTTYGYPGKHVTDNGQPFGSKDFQDYSREKGIIHQKCFLITLRQILQSVS